MATLLRTSPCRLSSALLLVGALFACDAVRPERALVRPLMANASESPTLKPAEIPRTVNVSEGALEAEGAQGGVRAAVGRARQPRVVTFEGACDASGAVELDARRFLVADDEDNRLRVYDADRGGRPIFEIDLEDRLTLPDSKPSEADFEAATRVGERAYFLASHGRTAKGKADPNRLLFLSTTLPGEDGAATLVGQPYRSLLEDLAMHPSLQRFDLASAALRAPKQPGGFNIEGLTADSDGSLWLGFRNPIPEGRALVVRLLNPDDVLGGSKARFADPVLLELGGLGVRALSSWRGNVIGIAGPSGDGGPFALFRFDGRSRAEPIDGADLAGFGAEAFFTPESRDEILVLSDDGTRLVDGKPCKKLREGGRKSFRGVWLGLTR